MRGVPGKSRAKRGSVSGLRRGGKRTSPVSVPWVPEEIMTSSGSVLGHYIHLLRLSVEWTLVLMFWHCVAGGSLPHPHDSQAPETPEDCAHAGRAVTVGHGPQGEIQKPRRSAVEAVRPEEENHVPFSFDGHAACRHRKQNTHKQNTFLV